MQIFFPNHPLCIVPSLTGYENCGLNNLKPMLNNVVWQNGSDCQGEFVERERESQLECKSTKHFYARMCQCVCPNVRFLLFAFSFSVELFSHRLYLRLMVLLL